MKCADGRLCDTGPPLHCGPGTHLMKLGTMLLLVLAFGRTVSAREPLFPFVVSYDAPAGVTNVSDWIARPAGGAGFVRAEDGRFATDAGPIRFWATNLCFEACFCSHQQADRLAARLARLGINCVRLHHMDSRAIWGESSNKLTIDPKKLERLDYLIHRLKEHGIYVNINLHVSRWLDEAEGFPKRQQRPRFDKGLDNFEPRMIELQEKYARDLLTHVNPYTRRAYTDEPAVAMVEINNENALFAAWSWNQLDDLPEPYATTYRKFWNRWLRAKYRTTAGLLTAWKFDIRRTPGAVGSAYPGEGETIEDETIPVVRHGASLVLEISRRDFVHFLWDTEAAYWQRMYRFLKKTLGVKSPVSGTQLSYSPPSIQARLDYLDAHSYFQHPHFPGRSWDMKNWTVRNVALVNRSGGTLSHLAVRRVAGKPFTVSEYNHPAPNEYAAEGFPMIAAFGALQGWDGIFSFAYSHDTDFEPRRITSFFDIKSDPSKLVHMPASAAMFLRGDVAPAERLVAVDVSVADQRKMLYSALNPWGLTAAGFRLDPRVALTDRVAMRLGPTNPPTWDPPGVPKGRRVFVSDTGQLRWDLSIEGAGYFTVDTPRTKLFTGFVHGRQFALGDVRLKIGETRLDWATVSLVAIDGERFDRPGKILLAATGVVRNQDARLARLENNNVTLGNRWGSEPVLCEGVPAEVVLPVAPRRVRCFALDESGQRSEPVEVISRDGRACLLLGPRYKTVWYEVEVR